MIAPTAAMLFRPTTTTIIGVFTILIVIGLDRCVIMTMMIDGGGGGGGGNGGGISVVVVF